MFNSIVYGWILHTHKVTQNKWGKETDVKKKKETNEKKRGMNTQKKGRKNEWEVIEKDKKWKKKLTKVGRKEKFYWSKTCETFFSPFLSHFLLRRLYFGGHMEKILVPHQFSLTFSPPNKNSKISFSLLPFPSLQNHPTQTNWNQMWPMYAWMVLWIFM